MKLLRIYLGEKDTFKGKPVFEHILKLAYEEGLKGITVLKGIMGFGHKRHIHRSDFFALSEDLPIVIDIVDEKERIDSFLEKVKELPFDGLVVEFLVNAHYVVKEK
ncbi:hypothetical protein SU69_00965 [Thermosipho melanesiensis]|uniref:Uncharacterized protein n=2 Tax=Thermosipho melanesiensis TaxID=46541 RepID=A6LJF7_THEM4|nr:DUF190 domain-containing protein [Thermosipho melanesiensis]ABR30058.1 protein of unknown function DUF190 [Thermosipho melanesiensis BI429]APT73255.1 hypothetical protein BW47_00995 [Thermosipho melanesiensis]OOC38651.1 hypothetical protein SU68_00965 [Thermosipho melanesiensis]OOC40455.1 hypothetical protein SU70_00965 [Thermosipho melanesiensis]OOC40720.1 hypothetical protein SU69_00965 [Thermosipho melanesiensis]